MTDAAVDGSGNIYIGGTFAGSFTLGNDTLTSDGGEDAFIAKVTPSGSVAWAKSIGAAGNDSGVVVTATDDHAYLGGEFSNSSQVDGVAVGGGAGDWYVVQFEADVGTANWAHELEAPLEIVDIDASGLTLAVATRTFGFGIVDKLDSLGNVTATSNNLGSVRGVRLLSDGAVIGFGAGDMFRLSANLLTEEWNADVGTLDDIVVLPDGGAVGVGSFAGTYTSGGNNLVSVGGDDMLVVQVSPLGQVGTAVSFGGPGNDVLNGVAGRDGELVVGGSSDGDLTISGTMLPAGGGRDAFVMKLDLADLASLWARRAGGAGDQTVHGVGLDETGRVDAAGTFSGTLDFGAPEMSAGGNDGFVVQLSP